MFHYSSIFIQNLYVKISKGHISEPLWSKKLKLLNDQKLNPQWSKQMVKISSNSEKVLRENSPDFFKLAWNYPKFLIKIFQFEFLILTEKSIFCHEIFQIFVDFLCKITTPWKKGCPPPSPCISSNPSINWGPVKPPPQQKVGCTLCLEF